MENEDKRTSCYKFRVNQRESEIIELRFKQSRFRQMSEFLRGLAISGQVINFDSETLTFLRRQIAGCCANINQIARKINVNNQVLTEDIKEIQTVTKSMYDSLRNLQNFVKSVACEDVDFFGEDENGNNEN